MKIIRFQLLALSITLGLAACAGNQTLDNGQRMTARGVAIAARGSDWNDGQKDMRKGHRMVQQSADRITGSERKIQRAQNDIAKAEAQIRTAQADRVTGEQMVSSGAIRMQEAEARYNQIRRQPSAINP